jgi:hypothetical protein
MLADRNQHLPKHVAAAAGESRTERYDRFMELPRGDTIFGQQLFEWEYQSCR